MDRAFTKMHGAGNDFVVFDARPGPLRLDSGQLKSIADRHHGIGCDQVIVIEPSERAGAFMRIYNADGGEAGACGNAARCVGAMLIGETGLAEAVLETASGLVRVERADSARLRVDMGNPRLDWRDIPLARAMDTLHVELSIDTPSGPLRDPVAVSMGNPHLVFFVDDPMAFDLATLGPQLERHSLFPARTNVTLAALSGAGAIVARVWERGAGLTLACGTAACATMVAAHRRRLTGRRATIDLPGGRLEVEWRADDHVLMTGPVATTFRGTVDLDRMAEAQP
ncbi:MAG: diaminopimelate epimerase [Alphaproteobacteria bacterium]|nr:diaminopimelate epimerase [Alphaproteobacteria bacterium]